MSLDEVFSKILKTTEKTIPHMKAKVVFIGKKKKKKKIKLAISKNLILQLHQFSIFFRKSLMSI